MDAWLFVAGAAIALLLTLLLHLLLLVKPEERIPILREMVEAAKADLVAVLISHVDVSTEAGENINTDVASTNAEIGAGLQTQYERAQILLAENRAIYLRMVNELSNKGQLEPPQIREWLGLTQLQAPNDALEPFEARLGDFEQRVA